MTDTQNSLAQLLAEHQVQIQARIDELCASVVPLPDNPAVTRLGTGPARAFVASSSAVLGASVKAHHEAFPDVKRPAGSNWSTFFHDWKLQYETVAGLLRSQTFGALATLLETGKHRDSSGHSHNIQTFAPEVILALRQVIGELPKGHLSSSISMALKSPLPVVVPVIRAKTLEKPIDIIVQLGSNIDWTSSPEAMRITLDQPTLNRLAELYLAARHLKGVCIEEYYAFGYQLLKRDEDAADDAWVDANEEEDFSDLRLNGVHVSVSDAGNVQCKLLLKHSDDEMWGDLCNIKDYIDGLPVEVLPQ